MRHDDVIANLNAQIESLRKALEPFVEAGKAFDREQRRSASGAILFDDNTAVCVDLGSCRQAIRALSVGEPDLCTCHLTASLCQIHMKGATLNRRTE